ncbi:MAG: potassium transporter [Leptolyngbya sp. DLM2.Bin15]|nr:MAG: potassium transporter [Leptolyngbya sp. DLM2.Bin15]
MQKQTNRLTLLSALAAVLIGFVVILELLLWSQGILAPGQEFWDVLENSIITLMGEYPDKPTTVAGRIFQLLLLIFGTFVFGAIIGKVSSFFVTRALWQEKQMKQFKDHFIVCNWNGKAIGIIHQLLEATKTRPTDIVIVSASLVPDRQELDAYSNIYFIQADPTHHATLESLHASQAKSVILLADEETEGPDEKNALIALAIKHLEQTPGQQKDIHVIAELVKLDRRRHLQEAGADEVVSARDYSSGIIAQTAMFRNMSKVYQQLLTYSDDSNEFYFITPGNYPTHFQGKTFPELSKWISDYNASHVHNPLILLGIKRGDGDILLNPKQDMFHHLAADDSLIVMAFQDVERIA